MTLRSITRHSSGHAASCHVSRVAKIAGALAFAIGALAPAATRADAPASAFAPTSESATAPAQQQTQAPGFYRMQLGNFQITALYDGFVKIDNKLLSAIFSGVSADDIQTLLARMYVPSANGVQTAVNAYLIHTGTHLILVDCGTAKTLGPTLGNLITNLRAAGYEPEQIDAVFLTHLHPDHACGLLTPEGQVAFPNATVHVAKTEADYWLDKARAAAAPESAQGVFKLAQNAIAPYFAAGKFQTYQQGDTLVPGIEAIATPGHTPGHTSYMLTSKGETLLVWGDLVHSHAIQFNHPEVALEYDSDKTQAVATRKKILAQAAASKLWVAGAHLPFPGIGHVRADEKGYTWVPVEYAPLASSTTEKN